MISRLVPLLLIALAVASTGTAFAGKPEIVEVTPGTYMIFKEDHRGIFGNLAKVKAAIIKQANEFAKAQGKLVIPLSCKEKPLGNGPAQWASFEYQFRLVPKDDPQAKGATLGPCPESVVHSTQSLTAEVTMKGDRAAADVKDAVTTEKPKDLYTELLKLDDLRKRGILTDAEFEAEKQKLLNSPKEEKPPDQRW